jgi:hypothetical protein
MWRSRALRLRHIAARFHAGRAVLVAVRLSTALSSVHDVTILNADFILHVTVRSAAAFSAINNLVALVDAKKAMHVAMSGRLAFGRAQCAATVHASALVHAAVTRRSALNSVFDDAATFRTTVVERGAMCRRAASNRIH